ncbi:helix-turn-helix domain-containing protein [Hymenobacter latericus]|uniref:helix-turn-helix domain-containing protein n=1 Tax=Hymenobacter sp. YIM 151858-1 TaxID=2987688 RepID=UPI002226CB52|nr:helix-turn-helix transcriptional regulator [Hymenobacter sp. YIM 151858-1]UYZ60360.1 helix-turn-helix domain-containing protein [Hymenobacter sp. YIM 151858-1]
MFSATRIQSIRKRKGYSQELLAEHSGVSLRTIQRVEQGETVPRGHTLQALATALGVSLEDFAPEPAPLLPTAPPPAATPALRSDPQFLQLLNLSALSFLVLPLLNVVVPLLLWRARRHQVAHVAELGRRVLGFQILWQVVCFFAYMGLVLGHWLAARYFQVVVPGTYLGVFILSYTVNVLAVLYYARRIRQGELDVYPIRL